jgi:hypothetical protein
MECTGIAINAILICEKVTPLNQALPYFFPRVDAAFRYDYSGQQFFVVLLPDVTVVEPRVAKRMKAQTSPQFSECGFIEFGKNDLTGLIQFPPSTLVARH